MRYPRNHEGAKGTEKVPEYQKMQLSDSKGASVSRKQQGEDGNRQKDPRRSRALQASEELDQIKETLMEA